jgi:diacylglycerol O-acyltransferase / wax synthase
VSGGRAAVDYGGAVRHQSDAAVARPREGEVMSDRLTTLDSMFLDLEEVDQSAHMHIGAALIFDPVPGSDGPPAVEDLRLHLADRLPLLPRYSQQLSSPHTGRVGTPSWEAAADLDLTNHVHRATLPAGATEDDLLDWLADFWSHRLDRRLPLWEITLLDGLPEGRWALASKTHHCLVDGVGSLDIGYALLDTEPHPTPVPAGAKAFAAAAATPEEENGSSRWISPGVVVQRARDAAHLARHPVATAQTAAAMTELLVKEEVVGAPRTSLNGTMSGARRFAVVRFGLDDIKAVKNRLGGTVNDVVLALCAGGLRRLLLERGEAVEHDLRAQIPVNVRGGEHEHDMGNRLTTLIAELPVSEPNPLVRYRLVSERAQALKGGSQPVAGRGLTALMDAMPTAFGSQLGRMLFNHARAFNLTITNVPGPQTRFYAFGAPMHEVLPLVPLFNTHRVGIAVISYAGQLIFGLNADRPSMPDLDVLARGIEESYTELS